MLAVGPYVSNETRKGVSKMLIPTAKSQAVIAGPHIFVSGQIPADSSGKLLEGSITDKTTASCEAVKNILEASGSSISRVVKVRLYRLSGPRYIGTNSCVVRL